jgi:hypothetical protein
MPFEVSFGNSNFTRHSSISYSSIIDDPGGHQGDTVQIIAQLHHSVASNKALDLLHQTMRTESHWHITMVIKMDSK